MTSSSLSIAFCSLFVTPLITSLGILVNPVLKSSKSSSLAAFSSAALFFNSSLDVSDPLNFLIFWPTFFLSSDGSVNRFRFWSEAHRNFKKSAKLVQKNRKHINLLNLCSTHFSLRFPLFFRNKRITLA